MEASQWSEELSSNDAGRTLLELSLRFENNDTLESDLVLRFVGQVKISNSLCLALDEKILPGQEDAGKIRLVLRTRLEQWLAAIEDVADGGTVYLPHGLRKLPDPVRYWALYDSTT